MNMKHQRPHAPAPVAAPEVPATTRTEGGPAGGLAPGPRGAVEPAATGAAAVKNYDQGGTRLSFAEKERRLGFFSFDLSEALSRHDEVVRRTGLLTLTCSKDGASMTGGTAGEHSLQRTAEGRDEWAKRVSTHWAGYLENNGAVLMPVPDDEGIAVPPNLADRFYAYLDRMNWVVDDTSIAALDMGFKSSAQIQECLDAYRRAKELGDDAALADLPKRLYEALRTLVHMIDDRAMGDLGFGFNNRDVQRDLTRFVMEACADTRRNGVVGAYLPGFLRDAIPQDLDGVGCRRYLEHHGYEVVSNRDTGGHGEAVTACGLVLSTNGYISRQQREGA